MPDLLTEQMVRPCGCFFFLLQMVIPGDVAEMTEFQEKTMNNSRFILELCFPNVQLVLPGKAFYEKLHNRYHTCSMIPNVNLCFVVAENQQIMKQ